MVTRHSSQQGAATLIVVMALFLVMALLAAYANRSLLFEQRLSSSYFRASLAQETAEAGIEWTLAQLNSTAVDDNCQPAATGGTRFVDRYVQVDPQSRRIDTYVEQQIVDCVRDAANDRWICHCPSPGTWAPPAPLVTASIAPSFLVTLARGGRPGTIGVAVTGCTDSVASNCALNASTYKKSREQQATVNLSSAFAFVSAVRTPPAAPLVASGQVTSAGTGPAEGLGLHNTDAGSAGLLLVSGGPVTGLQDTRLDSVPGTQPAQALRSSDNATANADLLWTFLGARAPTYFKHPALRTVTCTAGVDCGPTLAAAYDAGMRMVLVNGPLSLTSNQTLGSAASPMLIVANGAVTLNGPMQISGMLVAVGGLNWENSSGMPSLVMGSVVVQGDVRTQGAVDIVYQQPIADQLRNRIGGFVRVPGGWIDTQR